MGKENTLRVKDYFLDICVTQYEDIFKQFIGTPTTEKASKIVRTPSIT